MKSMARFSFYGYPIQVSSASEQALDDVRRDFSYFLSDLGEPGLEIEIFDQAPPYEGLPEVSASFYTPRNISYRSGDEMYNDYFGKALSIYNSKERKCRIYCDDADLRHEVSYLFILSAVGTHLDSIGIHRVHALGLEKGGKAILILLPIGGGKTTLAQKALAGKQFKLLSEDTPLITKEGKVLPFPLRVGLREDASRDIPERFKRVVRRMEGGPKTLIDIEYFIDNIGSPSEPSIILIGERSLGTKPRIKPLTKREALKAFVKNCVVGLGVYQGMEYVLERGAGEIFGKLGIAASRLKNSLKVINRSRSFKFVLGRDVEENYSAMADFINKEI
jgi:hypothetical protein